MSNLDLKKEIRFLIQKKANSFCADCYDSCALFVDINNCVFLCQKCSEIHKKFGFKVKNATNDVFAIEEIDKLKRSDNETFNKKWMSLYSSQSTKIPFGASDLQRQAFLYEKYISKRWFSSTQNYNNISFYNPHHLEIQETNLGDLDEFSFYDSSSSSSFLSEPTDQSDFTLSNIGQKEFEIINNESQAIYQTQNQMTSNNPESKMLCPDIDNDVDFDSLDSSDDKEMVVPNQESMKKKKKSKRRSQDKETETEGKKQSEKRRNASFSYSRVRQSLTSCRVHPGQKIRLSLSSSSSAKKSSKVANAKRKLVVLVISNAIAFDIIRHKKASKI